MSGRNAHQVAQLNVARAVGSIDDPRLADFMALLEEVNLLAEQSPGFVWRLQGASGNATDLRVEGDPRVIVNLTVWESVDDLFSFTYRSDHRSVFSRRFEWFERWEGPSVALWWQPVGTIPTIEDGFRRLERPRRARADASRRSRSNTGFRPPTRGRVRGRVTS